VEDNNVKSIVVFLIIFALITILTIVGCTKATSTTTPTPSRETSVGKTIAVLGDVNGDGSVNMGDVIKLERIIRGQDQRIPSADVNNDGQVNQEDVIKVSKSSRV
jgi:hypothetical protein